MGTGLAYLTLDEIAVWEPLAKKWAVSEVARSPHGFLPHYKKIGGRLHDVSPEWRKKRRAFIKRHMAQVRQGNESLWDDRGRPTRRHLALIMWAYSPERARLKEKVERWKAQAQARRNRPRLQSQLHTQ